MFGNPGDDASVGKAFDLMLGLANKYASGSVGAEELYKLRDAELKNQGVSRTERGAPLIR